MYMAYKNKWSSTNIIPTYVGKHSMLKYCKEIEDMTTKIVTIEDIVSYHDKDKNIKGFYVTLSDVENTGQTRFTYTPFGIRYLINEFNVEGIDELIGKQCISYTFEPRNLNVGLTPTSSRLYK